jgi:DNA-binding Xre family transcriptional regulator
MKKKNLSKKLSLKKQKISKLSTTEAGQIKGGTSSGVCGISRTMINIYTQPCGPLCHIQ